MMREEIVKDNQLPIVKKTLYTVVIKRALDLILSGLAIVVLSPLLLILTILELLYHGKPVLGISTRAFYNHDNLEEIVFENPENIIFIGRLSFYNCNKLKYIDLSHTEEIDKNAFQFCKSLNKDIKTEHTTRITIKKEPSE